MSIRPVEFNGILQRTDDVSSIKHQQEAKSHVDQQNIQTVMERQDDAKMHQVTDKSQSDKMNNHADAREEGKGMYFDQRKKRDNDSSENPSGDGVVRKKISSGGFDIKI